MLNFIAALLAAAVTMPDGAESRLDAALDHFMEGWYSKTGLVYECPVDQVQSSADGKDGFFHWQEGLSRGYGRGMGDCSLNGGTVLSGLVDEWEVLGMEYSRTHSEAVRKKLSVTRDEAEKIASGILNLATVHNVPGFVARGICADDGKTVCSLSSRDQYTHWVHSLFRYTLSGMASKRFARQYEKEMVNIARFMEQRITSERGYNFGLADGTYPDPRGICTMWGDSLRPHEQMRLPMIYCAAFMASGDEHWRSMYEKYIDEAITRTMQIADVPLHSVPGWMPCYSLYQAQASIEVVLAYETGRADLNTERIARIRAAMGLFALHARTRAMDATYDNPPYGMCWDGELLLAMMMDPDDSMSQNQDISFVTDFLARAIERKDLISAGWCRTAHLYASYWRFRADMENAMPRR